MNCQGRNRDEGRRWRWAARRRQEQDEFDSNKKKDNRLARGKTGRTTRCCKKRAFRQQDLIVQPRWFKRGSTGTGVFTIRSPRCRGSNRRSSWHDGSVEAGEVVSPWSWRCSRWEGQELSGIREANATEGLKSWRRHRRNSCICSLRIREANATEGLKSWRRHRRNSCISVLFDQSRHKPYRTTTALASQRSSEGNRPAPCLVLYQCLRQHWLGARRVGGPKISLFFFLSPTGNFILPSLSGGSSRGILVVFEGRDPQMCTSGLSGCRVKPRRALGPPGFHTTTIELQTHTIQGSGASDTTKIPREDPPRERRKNDISGGREKKKREILGPPPTPNPSHPSGPPPFGAPPFGPPPFGALTDCETTETLILATNGLAKNGFSRWREWHRKAGWLHVGQHQTSPCNILTRLPVWKIFLPWQTTENRKSISAWWMTRAQDWCSCRLMWALHCRARMPFQSSPCGNIGWCVQSSSNSSKNVESRSSSVLGITWRLLARCFSDSRAPETVPCGPSLPVMARGVVGALEVYRAQLETSCVEAQPPFFVETRPDLLFTNSSCNLSMIPCILATSAWTSGTMGTSGTENGDGVVRSWTGQKWIGQKWSNKDGQKWIGQKRSQPEY